MKKNTKRKVYGRQFLATFMAALMLFGSGMEPAQVIKAASTVTLQNPRISEVQGGDTDEASGLSNPRVKMRIRDTITFGSYWQEDTNGDGVADQKDDKQPIKWQVLSVNKNDVLLLADQVLDSKSYHTEYGPVTWENCSLRRWLNEDFYNTAFSDAEKAAITETIVANADNLEFGTKGGTDTKDKVYLLSLNEVSASAYGFHGTYRYSDQARQGKATSYAEEQGVYTYYDRSGYWWLRSPGSMDSYAADVSSDGIAYPFGADVDRSNHGVRPALHLNLSAVSVNESSVAETAMKESEWDVVELGTWEDKPVQWRVLSVKDGDALLLADGIIADKVYYETDREMTWEKSTLRTWLNEDFYSKAFSDSEKEGIRDFAWENLDNPWFGTKGGNNTTDYISLLSLSDVLTKEYGFPTAYCCYSKARTAGGYWWLRSPGSIDVYAAYVYNNGYTSPRGCPVSVSTVGVRPALHFNLSSSSLKKAGTVTAKEDFADGDNTIQNPGSANGDDTQTKPTADAKPGKVTSLKAKNNKKKTVTLTWKKVAKAKKYQVQYSQNKKLKKAKTKTTQKVSYKITKLSKKKTYYFRVCAVSASGKKGAWSKTVKVKIKK